MTPQNCPAADRDQVIRSVTLVEPARNPAEINQHSVHSFVV